MMLLSNRGAQVYVPDGQEEPDALKRTTHMAIAAHHDDIEIMAYHGIERCFGRDDAWFCAVVATDGTGSLRDGAYKEYDDETIRHIRAREQKKAACIGEYGSLIMLDYSSEGVKSPDSSKLLEELAKILELARPEVVYTHNPADRHDTHAAVALRVIQAIRSLPEGMRPQSLYGCEVWGSLDWLACGDRVDFDVSGRPNIADSLLGVFDSQISGGKRYDKAMRGRQLANATFRESHNVDKAQAISFGVDLTELVRNVKLDVVEYIRHMIDNFGYDVIRRLERLR